MSRFATPLLLSPVLVRRAQPTFVFNFFCVAYDIFQTFGTIAWLFFLGGANCVYWGGGQAVAHACVCGEVEAVAVALLDKLGSVSGHG